MSATCCPYVNLLPNGEWPVWVRPTFLRLTCCDLLLLQDINCTPVVNFEIHSLRTIYFHYCFLHLHMAILLNTLHLISVLLALSLGIQKVISIWLLILVWTVNLFSPWYSWKVTELAFNNNHSLTQSLTSIWTRSYLTYKEKNTCNVCWYTFHSGFSYERATSFRTSVDENRMTYHELQRWNSRYRSSSMLSGIWLSSVPHSTGGRRGLMLGSWKTFCNQCLSPLKLWVQTPFMVRCTGYNIIW